MTNDIQKRIRFFRKQKRMTQSDVAQVLNMTRSQYAYNENRAKRLSPAFIDDLARLFEVSVHTLMDGVQEREAPKVADYHAVPANPLLMPIVTAKQKKLLDMFLLLPGEEQSEIFNSVREKYVKHNVKKKKAVRPKKED